MQYLALINLNPRIFIETFPYLALPLLHFNHTCMGVHECSIDSIFLMWGDGTNKSKCGCLMFHLPTILQAKAMLQDAQGPSSDFDYVWRIPSLMHHWQAITSVPPKSHGKPRVYTMPQVSCVCQFSQFLCFCKEQLSIHHAKSFKKENSYSIHHA